ncbi:MAG: phosphatidylglycerophosphatase A [Candidatus Latescibacteria bacterium]|nr:phosphatidylglycerophosphatase A [Candidatus Latescibacterota bacterium]
MSHLNKGEKSTRLFFWIASGGGVGVAPVAPGTAGSLLGLLVYVLLPEWPPMVWVGITLILFLIGVRAATSAEFLWSHDAGRIVIDEIVGMWVALLFLPRTVRIALLGFFIFRLFDIVKPFPADRSQRLKAGWGVMVDDLIAGIYTNFTLQLLEKFVF